MRKPTIPTSWYQWGPLSAWLAQVRPPLSPPVLVLSLGRSGSSWVGDTLGRAGNALFLREPITQSLMPSGGTEPDEVIDPHAPRADFERWATRAFMGLPVFPRGIVRYPEQWHYGQRHRRRLVIKDIKPFACAWLLHAYRPRLIYLVRHPAAVALSNMRLGFIGGTEAWRHAGEHQGRAHRYVLDCLKNWQDYRIVQYEVLCADPLSTFRELFDFAELDWSEATETNILENSADGDRSVPYSVARNSREMINAWRAEITVDALTELRLAFQAHNLPWYTSPGDWQTEVLSS